MDNNIEDEKNLIEKINDPQDRRKQTVRLSNAGEAMMNEAFSTIESRFLKRIESASKEDLEDIAQAIQLLQKNLFYE